MKLLLNEILEIAFHWLNTIHIAKRLYGSSMNENVRESLVWCTLRLYTPQQIKYNVELKQTSHSIQFSHKKI